MNFKWKGPQRKLWASFLRERQQGRPLAWKGRPCAEMVEEVDQRIWDYLPKWVSLYWCTAWKAAQIFSARVSPTMLWMVLKT